MTMMAVSVDFSDTEWIFQFWLLHFYYSENI